MAAWLHAVIDVPDDRHAEAARFWGEALGWPLGAPWPGHPKLSSLEPPADAPYVHLQRVDAAPRVHLDLEAADPAATAAHARDVGAEEVAVHDGWRTLRSPGGLPFCVVPVADHRGPER